LIDKARLHRKGLLNGYNYKTVGFDKHLLAFLKIDGDSFEEVVNRLDEDEAIRRRSRPTDLLLPLAFETLDNRAVLPLPKILKSPEDRGGSWRSRRFFADPQL
jgi:hypothetical protein